MTDAAPVRSPSSAVKRNSYAPGTANDTDVSSAVVSTNDTAVGPATCDQVTVYGPGRPSSVNDPFSATATPTSAEDAAAATTTGATLVGGGGGGGSDTVIVTEAAPVNSPSSAANRNSYTPDAENDTDVSSAVAVRERRLAGAARGRPCHRVATDHAVVGHRAVERHGPSGLGGRRRRGTHRRGFIHGRRRWRRRVGHRDRHRCRRRELSVVSLSDEADRSPPRGTTPSCPPCSSRRTTQGPALTPVTRRRCTAPAARRRSPNRRGRGSRPDRPTTAR